MRNMYQCEKCGRVFADYDECMRHEDSHYVVSGWCREYEQECKDRTEYSDTLDAPSKVAVELNRWSSEKGCSEYVVAMYKFVRFVPADEIISDTVRRESEQQSENNAD